MKSLPLCLLMCLCHLASLGCQRQGNGAVDAGPSQSSVHLSVDFAARLDQLIDREDPAEKSIRLLRGALTATRVDDGSETVFDWSAAWDDGAWTLTSSKTIVLDPGQYELSLQLSDAEYQYFGQGVATIEDGENQVAITMRPVLGDLDIEAEETEIPAIRFQYPPEQLARLGMPRLGVSVDGGDEQVFAFDPDTGLTDMYAYFTPGAHTIRLRLYDGSIQRGRSILDQETVVIEPGRPLIMDLVPLHGETIFDLGESGADLDIEIEIPGEAAEEVGGIDNLRAVFSFVGASNPPVERELVLVPDEDDFEAELTIPEVRYDVITYSLTLFDRTRSPEEQIGACSGTATLTSESNAVICNLDLLRRALAGGQIFAVAGINVLRPDGAPVAGAVVTHGTEVLGVTGSGGFGTPGYLRLFLVPGDYRLTGLQVDAARTGRVAFSVESLDIVNHDIILDEDLLLCTGGDVCPADSFVPGSACSGFADTCDQEGTQAGTTTRYDCVAGGCLATELADEQSCYRDTDEIPCAESQYSGWGTCGTFGNTCDESGTRTRTRLDFACAAGVCRSFEDSESESCARDTDGDTCGTTSRGPWSACSGFGNTCDESGTQSRTVTQYVCSDSGCSAVESTQTRSCTRTTDGDTCGTTSRGPWSACSGFGNTCDESGTQSRTVTRYVCSGSGCSAVESTQTRSCTRDTDGDTCGSNATCTDGECSGGGSVCSHCPSNYRCCGDDKCVPRLPGYHCF